MRTSLAWILLALEATQAFLAPPVRPLRSIATARRGGEIRAATGVDPARDPSDVTVAVAGATGYIGRAVVRECVRRGYKTLALVREESADRAQSSADLKGSEIVKTELSSTSTLSENVFGKQKVDVVISCIASRSGVPEDAWRVDHGANVNLLDAALASGNKPAHFVMLSAFCVRKPELVFQHAKLKFEEYLRSKSDELVHTIVRPTAFFKSVSGQLEIVQKGYPYVMFGDGEICRCNPISESELAMFIVNSIGDRGMHNRVMDVGGPDEGLTPKEQAELLFAATGKEPNYIRVPIGLFDGIIGVIDFFAKFLPQAADAAELARIGKYYAVEDMWTLKPEEKFGRITLKDHFERIAREGQEYDPFTTMFASSEQKSVQSR